MEQNRTVFPRRRGLPILLVLSVRALCAFFAFRQGCTLPPLHKGNPVRERVCCPLLCHGQIKQGSRRNHGSPRRPHVLVPGILVSSLTTIPLFPLGSSFLAPSFAPIFLFANRKYFRGYENNHNNVITRLHHGKRPPAKIKPVRGVDGVVSPGRARALRPVCGAHALRPA